MENKKQPKFKDLPEYVQDILLSDESTDANGKIIEEFNLSKEQVKILFDILRKIVFKQIDLSQLLESLEPLNLGKEQTKKIAIEILKRRVLPLSDYLKVNTLLYIKKWGGEIPDDELLNLVKVESRHKIDVDSIARQIIKEIGIELEGHVLKKRFRNIVLSFIRNVRSLTEIAIILKRSQKIGGMGFNQEVVDKVINVLQGKIMQPQDSIGRKKKVVKSKKLKFLIKAPAGKLLDIESKVQRLPKPKINIKKTKNIKKTEDVFGETKQINAGSEKAVEDIEKAVKKNQQKLEKPSANVFATEASKVHTGAHTAESPVLPKILKTPEKTMVESVSNQPKIYGPGDELQNIRLVDWRRWGTCQEAMLKIQEKINLLAEDSLLKKAEGIKAWGRSEINKLYLEIGEEAIDKGKSIEEIIKGRQKQGRKTLTEEEFNAVAELNQKLRF